MAIRQFTFLILAMTLLTSLQSVAQIWPTERKWNESVVANCSKWPVSIKTDCESFLKQNVNSDSRWSDVYSAWVKQFWHQNIYMDETSFLKGIATDCADASYGMRIYFSWLFNLEFKIHYPGFKDRFITNLDKNFNHVAQPQQRLKAFLLWLGGLVSTRTLPDDTYPIELNRSYFRPGILYNTSTHTDQLVEIDVFGIGRFLYSTVPLEIRSLKEILDYPSSMPMDLTNHRDGFRAFIEPQNYGLPLNQNPGFSLEQYDFLKSVANQKNDKSYVPQSADLGLFYESLQKKFQTVEEPIGRKVARFLDTVCQQVKERSNIIIDSVNIYNGKCIKSAKDYDEFSTPSRDRELANLFEKGKYFYDLLQNPEFRQQALTEKNNSVALKEYHLFVIDTIFRNPKLDIPVSEDWSDNYCQLEPLIRNPKDRKLTIRRIWQKILTKSLIPDPNATFYQRWGFEPYEQKCPVLDL